MTTQQYRLEHDLLGERRIPVDVYYGIHTLRAVENFPISGVSIGMYPELVQALATIKQAAAITNRNLGLLSAERTEAIVFACERIRAGHLHDQFVVDVIQGGAGTSTNMNANEVIANLALEYLGHARGDYHQLHPNEHVNLSQSTNDVYPTAVRLAVFQGTLTLGKALSHLQKVFADKAHEFRGILKMGRTQLQDAVPMTLGQEFSTFADMLADSTWRLVDVASSMCEINLGATAIGTGINTHPEYAARVCDELRNLLSHPVSTAPNLIKATQDCGDFVELSGVLKRCAVSLSKTCNDLRLLSSGPRAGIGEINLPVRQAGSSIMPGKVNPVMPEVVNQIAFEVIGNDLAITFAAEAGQLQLNAFEPIIAYSLFKSLTHLRQGCAVLAEHCVSGITVNLDQLQSNIARSIGIVTALNPYIGYVNATSAAAEAHSSGQGVMEIVVRRGLMSVEQINEVLHPACLTQPYDFTRGLLRQS